MSTAKIASSSPTKVDVQQFWDSNACGKKFVNEKFGTREFFDKLEKHRYELEPHIREIIPFAEMKNKKVLEIGCGLGTDAIQFGRAGALYHAIDLTPTAVQMTQSRFAMEAIAANIQIADSENIPFPDNTFDYVYSNGVIHHTPNIEKAVAEIHRVLRPGGKVIVMVYHKNSFNYYINILLLRRIGIWLLFLPGGNSVVHLLTGESREALNYHKKLFREMGFRYFTPSIFLSHNTDGPENPLSRVYSTKGLKQLFSAFSSPRILIRYLNTHRIPLIRTIVSGRLERWLASKFGWHIYIFAEK